MPVHEWGNHPNNGNNSRHKQKKVFESSRGSGSGVGNGSWIAKSVFR